MTPSTHWFESDPLWFKRAVFYEVHLRGFSDSNADGSGDFRGLTEKLEYLQWLGIDCVWLLPMYALPLRDGGYDIADFYSVHPDYGTIEDIRGFIDTAHQRGVRVIADMVINHTSSDHPWFQESRSRADSPKRDWYMWSDTDDRYADARIIFVDSETSNWTWDPVAGAYYWHRFFAHQPDLNYDNPEVEEAMLNVIRFWLDLGLDGLRLDAVPYLFAREGTSCENVPETHAFLRRVRAEVEAAYTDRVLLAEANQWPAEVVEYFGDGDECQMAFHFPVMPRMFMALRREDATPVYDTLANTPAIPEVCQWGLFLRNHDELTLEMVTAEERDYMYAEYAEDPRGKLNLGIRRRLAPLLDNGRDEMELMTAILFSLPGSPVLYYGDEIGMGDNVYLGDRDSVRTPMQWTGDRNGGFSQADFAQLYLPPLMDPVYGFQAVNVEAQLRTPTSLLRWMRRIIALRKEHPVFGIGTYEPLASSNPRIFAHVRRYGDDVALCVHNFVRSAQAVELDLVRYEGRYPVEIFGRSRFPRIGELSYLLTFGPRLLLVPARARGRRRRAARRLVTANGVAAAFAAGRLDFIDQTALADWIGRQRWYATKGRGIGQASVVQALPLGGEPPLVLAIVALRFASGTHDLDQVPVGLHRAVDGFDHEPICEADGWIVHGALGEPNHCKRLARLLSASAVVERSTGRVDFYGLEGSAPLAKATSVRVLAGEQSNTSLVFDELVVLKVFRRLAAGTNPELEMLRFLSMHSRENIPELLGWFEHRSELIDATLGIAVRHVAGARDGWEMTLEALAAGEGETLMAPLAELGTVVGRMHTLLGSEPADPDFAPEQPSVEWTALLAATIDEHLERTLDERADDPVLEPIARRSEELREYVQHAAQGATGGLLIRHHGDLHLGQTMAAPGGWVIVDFEGEPTRSLLERRRKRTALRDVACMLRSFAYAAAVAELQLGVRPPAEWEKRARQTFVQAYLGSVDARRLPSDRAAIEQTLAFLELEKAVYELRYEIDHRPDWVPIPVAALSRLLGARAT